VIHKAWAVPVLIVSLIGILLQMGHAFFATAMIEVQGGTAAVLPLLIVIIAICLVWFSCVAKKTGWIG